MKKILNKIHNLILPLLAFIPLPILAANPPTGRYGLDETANKAQLPGTIQNRGLPEIVGLIIQSLMGIIGTILVLLLIYGGFLWMTAAGEEKKVEEAKKIIKNSIIGLLVIFLAYGIAKFVIDALTSASA